MLQWPCGRLGDSGRVPEQGGNGGRPAADRVVFGELTQAVWQPGDRDERGRDEGQREDDQEGDPRYHVGRAGDNAYERADPQHREREQTEDRESAERVGEAALDPPADNQTADDHDADPQGGGGELGGEMSEQEGRAVHGQGAEAGEDALAPVGGRGGG